MPPKRAPGFGSKPKVSFSSYSRTGAKRTVRMAQPLYPGGTPNVPPPLRQPSSKPYKQGYGIEEPKPQALAPIEDLLLCPCPETKNKKRRLSLAFTNVSSCQNPILQRVPRPLIARGLMRRHLFPLTPSEPNHAIHVEQMRSMHNMHYLCRASAHAIANWARAEYRYKQRLSEALPMYGRLMLSLEKDLRNGSELQRACPACMYMSGPKIVAADGNMQLRRFAKTKDPKDVAFTDQEEVDWYWVKDNQVVQYRNAATDGCSTWQALEKGRGRTDHLDQNGAFACTCGHGLPLAITDITTPGEHCLKKVTEMSLYGSNIRIMYDVGCKIRKALQESLDCIKDVPIAVGIFYITGHAPRCQIHYHPRLKEGRLTLTIALDFYMQQRTDNIGVNLRRKYKRALELKSDALKTLLKAGIQEGDENSLASMARKWKEHVDETVQRDTNNTRQGGRIGAASRAVENLRLAIGIYDLIERAFKQQGNGHNRTQNLAGQRKAARAQVEKQFNNYLEKLSVGPLFGFELYPDSSTVLKKNSHFRFRCNIISPVETNTPYDAFHGLRRANEELELLKDEASSVIKFGHNVISKLQEAIASVPETLERAEAWMEEQQRLLGRIANGSASIDPDMLSRGASVVVRGVQQDGEEDDDDEEGGQETEELAPDIEAENDDDDEELIDDNDDMFMNMFPGMKSRLNRLKLATPSATNVVIGAFTSLLKTSCIGTTYRLHM
ncbi:hypothetical protein BDB00DRAFT_871788 [Zychaea mexicana]|uniref:uncharacterized protein n=1 Tax=Zychaea mexicana TaxID=64656 RepID=UPI0022FE3E56|nr:uncharacterized protein BDB00DRAFT_871788 [Zychaea mexicana]KAI9494028.1 hypothetical protein BDB00DRAFT_871788 [Zychaea mexicana]